MTRRRLALGMVLLGIALLASAGYLLARPRPIPPVARRTQPIISPAFPTPGTTGLDGYRVKSTDLGIDLPLVDGDGWTVPYSRAALYPGMTAPGTGNRAMLYAHALPGMFGPLSHAAAGQHVDVVRAGRPTLHYVITKVYLKWPPGDLTYTRPADHEELVLLTCTTYSANDPRILAIAEPL